jgi:hypothetical protein
MIENEIFVLPGLLQGNIPSFGVKYPSFDAKHCSFGAKSRSFGSDLRSFGVKSRSFGGKTRPFAVGSTPSWQKNHFFCEERGQRTQSLPIYFLI